MKSVRIGVALLAVAALGACASIPSGPGVMALPGTGKSFDQFRYDEADCRQYALAQSGGNTPNQAAADRAVQGAVVGTMVGALAGAAIGGHGGAGVGAGVGLMTGAAAGAGAGQQSAYISQSRYDSSYVQCMYAKGHKVPVSGQLSQQVVQQPSGSPPPAPTSNYRPPPSYPPQTSYPPPSTYRPPVGYPPPNSPPPNYPPPNYPPPNYPPPNY